MYPDIENIILALEWDAWIDVSLPWGIFWWEPEEEPSGLYLILNNITSIHKDSQRTFGIQFNFCWHNRDVRMQDLLIPYGLVDSFLLFGCNWKLDYNWYNVVATREGQWVRLFTSNINEKERNVLIKEYFLTV